MEVNRIKETPMEKRIGDIEGRITILESRIRLMMRGYGILLIALIIALYIGFHTSHNLSETTRESTHQRVITVEQRCELTMLIQNVLVQDDPKRSEAFIKSYKGCENQLQKVKEIANKVS